MVFDRTLQVLDVDERNLMADKYKVTLYQPVVYEIKVPGHLDESWVEWTSGVTVTVEITWHEQPVTVIQGTFDQAALHGLLRRLYSLGLPIISVMYIG